MKQNLQEGWWISIILILIILITFLPLLKTGFTSEDELTVYPKFQLEDYSISGRIKDMVENGSRPQLLLPNYLLMLPYLVNNFLYFRIFAVLLHLLCIVAFGSFLYTLFKSRKIALFGSVLYILFLQNTWEHSLVTTYPMHYFVFSLFLLSLTFFNLYLEKRRNTHVFISAALYFFSLFYYEMYISYIFIFLVLGFFHSKFQTKQKKNTFSELFHTTQYHLMALGIYLVAYLFFLLFFNPHYDGVSVSFSAISLLSWLKVVLTYSLSSLPGFAFFAYHRLLAQTSDLFAGHWYNLIYIIVHSKSIWIVQSILGGCVIAFFIRHIEVKWKKEQVLNYTVIGVLLLISSNLLLAWTKKHQNLVANGAHIYHTTSFSYFGAIVLMVIAVLYGKSLIKNPLLKNIFTYSVIGVSMLLILLISYSNYYITESQYASKLKWDTVDHFMQTQEWSLLPEQSTIIAPSLWANQYHIWQRPEYWSEYAYVTSHKKVFIINSTQGTGEGESYYLRYMQDPKDINQALVFAKINPLHDPLEANIVHLYTYSKHKQYQIIFMANTTLVVVTVSNTSIIHACQGGLCIIPIEDEGDTSTSRLWTDLTQIPGNGWTHAEINASNIQVESIMLSYYQ